VRHASHGIGEDAAQLHLCFRRDQQMQARRTDDDTRQKLPQDGWQLEAHEHFSQRPRCNKDQDETENADQRFGDLQVMAADFTQQGGQKHQAGQHCGRP